MPSPPPGEAAPPAVLALPGPQYCFRYDGDFVVCSAPIVLHQEGGQGRGTGWSVWDGAAAAARHLEAAAAQILASQPALQSVLELGSGTGLAGLAAAAALKLPTQLTDLPEVLPALRRNAVANPRLAGLVSVAALDWREPSSFFDQGGSTAGNGSRESSSKLGSSSIANGSGSQAEAAKAACSSTSTSRGARLVLAADCVWLEELVGPFVQTLRLAACQPGDRALLAYQSRSSRVDALLFGQLEAAFEVQPAALSAGEPPRGAMDLYWLSPRPAAVA